MPPKGRDPKIPGRGAALSKEERALWERVTQDTAPLKKRVRPEPAEPPADKPPEAPAKRAARIKPPRPSPAPPRAAPPSLGHGDIADLDKRSAERLRRGRMAIEATLDLHGYSQNEARRELAAFLARAQGAGKRCVLVVTGKGDIGRGGGVLRAQAPDWLNEPENRARILAFDYAQPKHGGLGALYVLLRKARS